MSALVICTTKGSCLPVMAASVSFYLPEFYTVYLCGSDMIFPRHRTINLQNNSKNFGDAYNYAVGEAFKDHVDVIVANDDVVLTPNTHETLMEDLRVISEDNRGWVGARADYARGMQNVRFRHNADGNTIRHASENLIVEVDVIAPYFAYISQDAWIDFPPLNWFSDDIQCIDMAKKGLKHYISRAYVHHVGSQTCGLDYQKCMEEARPWIEENRPELPWFKKN